MLSAQPGGNTPSPVTYNPNEFWLRTLLRWYIGLVIRPSPTIREIVERRPVWWGLGTLISILLFDGAITFLAAPFIARGAIPDTQQILASVTATGVLLFSFVVFSALVHFVTRLLGGSGSFTGIVTAISFVSILQLFDSVYLVAAARLWALQDSTDGPTDVPTLALNVTIQVLVLAWTLAIVALAVRENYGLSTRSAAVSVVLTMAAFLIALSLLFAGLLVLYLLILLVLVVGSTIL